MSLTAEQILAARGRLRSELVPCPELGGDIRIREMTGAEREEWESLYTGGMAERHHIRAATVCLTAVDDEGKRLFRDDQITEIAELPARVLIRLADVAIRLSGLTPDAVEEAEKN